MAVIPAVCDTCGTVFPSGFDFTNTTAMMSGNKSGPCPTCGGMGSLPDGFYEFVGETITIVSSWAPERIQKLSEALQAAKSQPDPRAAAEAAIASEDDLLGVAERLLIPRDAGQFWGMVAALLALLALLSASQSDQNITVNVDTVIERTITEPEVPPLSGQGSGSPSGWKFRSSARSARSHPRSVPDSSGLPPIPPTS